MLPRADLGGTDDFSFSGLKTALLRLVEPYRLPDAPEAIAPSRGPFKEHRPARYREAMPVEDLAASFQLAVVEPLVEKTVRAAEAHGVRTVLLAGGVAANRLLRTTLEAAVAERLPSDVVFRCPPFTYCTDNAAMIAGAGYFALRRGDQAGWEADIAPRLPITGAAG